MITIVSGLPRSGTSLMMQILEKGGLEILTDNLRVADENNMKGYYEFEKVKSLMKDNSWLFEAEDKVVKIIAQLLNFLPDKFQFRILFMTRDLNEIVKSQTKMIKNLGNKSALNTDVLKNTFTKQVDSILQKLEKLENVSFTVVNFNELIANPDAELKKIIEFIPELKNLNELISIIDNNLYRERV
ncbi:MAG: sulfotransferase [Candidatus Delongbacteria bacterium]|nr:sulfotransferase [Candidatus Delongbacteria bacterium]MBN2835223.1 sulfotransferase [Candidatus Delongbacteria bacterium]